MSKINRLAAIERIIKNEVITSQADLLKILEDQGMGCTQATLSRNLRQLQISRVTDKDGDTRYRIFRDNTSKAHKQDGSDFKSVITETIWAANMLLIKTYPGYAAAIASRIDQTDNVNIAGTIAGDDTVLVIPKDNYPKEVVKSTILEIIS